MADQIDVTTALAARVWGIIYPGGPNTSPANGYVTKVHGGWPDPRELDADMAATPPVLHISVFATDTEKDTTRYPREWQDLTRGVATITAVVSKQLVTLGGSITIGQYVSIVALNKAASYAAKSGDDLPAIATALAALLTTAGVPATASGSAISIPSADVTDMVARVGAPGTVIQETRRQQKEWLITVWAPTQMVCDATAAIVDNVLAAIAPPMSSADYLSFPDGSTGWLLYGRSRAVDRLGTKTIRTRDLCYFVEYPTTQTAPGYPITVITNEINSADGSTQGSTVTTNQ